MKVQCDLTIRTTIQVLVGPFMLCVPEGSQKDTMGQVYTHKATHYLPGKQCTVVRMWSLSWNCFSWSSWTTAMREAFFKAKVDLALKLENVGATMCPLASGTAANEHFYLSSIS